MLVVLFGLIVEFDDTAGVAGVELVARVSLLLKSVAAGTVLTEADVLLKATIIVSLTAWLSAFDG